jgi:hypothetical protein
MVISETVPIRADQVARVWPHRTNFAKPSIGHLVAF